MPGVRVRDRAAELRLSIGADQVVIAPERAPALAEGNVKPLPGPTAVEHDSQLGVWPTELLQLLQDDVWVWRVMYNSERVDKVEGLRLDDV